MQFIRTACLRIGLFTEPGCRVHTSLSATVEALVAHRPHDASIIEYSRPTTLKTLVCARELVTRAAADRIDLVHVATSGPLAIAALLVARSFGVPAIGSFHPPSPATGGLMKAYLRALVRQTRRLLVTSMTARAALIGAGIRPSMIALWSPGVDTLVFAPSKRSSGAACSRVQS